MSSLLTLKMGMVVEQQGRDDKGEREGFFFLKEKNWIVGAVFCDKLSQKTQYY